MRSGNSERGLLERGAMERGEIRVEMGGGKILILNEFEFRRLGRERQWRMRGDVFFTRDELHVFYLLILLIVI